MYDKSSRRFWTARFGFTWIFAAMLWKKVLFRMVWIGFDSKTLKPPQKSSDTIKILLKKILTPSVGGGAKVWEDQEILETPKKYKCTFFEKVGNFYP